VGLYKWLENKLNKIIKNFFIKENNNGYIWNTVAGLINASEAVILSMVITRTNGLEDAGILAIAFAIGNLFANIGKFGVRNYQVSDIKEEFSFSNYFMSRMISAGLMLIVSAGYVIIQLLTSGYSLSKAVIVFLMCLIYLVESIEDVFWGLYQKKDALDVGAKIFSLRWGLTITGMSLVLIYQRDLILAMLAGVIITGIISLYTVYLTYPRFREEISWRIHKKDIVVLKKCVPLFGVLFMTFYVTNAPKYAIDRWLTEKDQACYGFIAMPVFIIELLNGFIYQPILVKMSIEWQSGNNKVFVQRVYKQCLIILGLTVVCLLGAWLLGIPVLSELYATNLNDYKTELLILLIGGGMLAIVGFFSTLMTIMRKQRWIMWGFIVIAFLAAFFSDYCVKEYGVLGASVLYTALMMVLAIIFVGMFCVNIGRQEK